MIKTCNLFETTGSGFVLIATLTLDGTTLGAKLVAGNANLRAILNEPHGRWTSEANPVEWFNSLPDEYHGSYLNAVMVQD